LLVLKVLVVRVEVDQALLTVKLACLSHGFARGMRTLYKSRALLILQQRLDQVYVNIDKAGQFKGNMT
jgi:hypothetical protein|tara:strand:+ start:2391 stop:2594 length:204 start_codon:yes stop_codon:yes gene_type:complete